MPLIDIVKSLCPPWLADDSQSTPTNPVGGIGGRFMYDIALGRDTIIEKMDQAIHARMPGLGTPTALGLIGKDRVIVRGINETDEAYALRLKRAFETWQHAGQAIAVMKAVLSYLSTQAKAMVITDANNAGVGFGTLFPTGASLSLPPCRWSFTWKWDTGYGIAGVPNTTNGFDPHPLNMGMPWWRCWLLLWSVGPNAWTSDEGTWGDGALWGDSTASWGLSIPSTEIDSVRILVGTWKCANSWYRWLVVSLDANFADWNSGSAYYPNTSDWGDWSKITNNQYVPSRAPLLRYCSGIATSGNQGPNGWPPIGAPGFPYY